MVLPLPWGGIIVLKRWGNNAQYLKPNKNVLKCLARVNNYKNYKENGRSYPYQCVKPEHIEY